jgi:predicted lipoprotein with Yx(FWY)xxD motif
MRKYGIRMAAAAAVLTLALAGCGKSKSTTTTTASSSGTTATTGGVATSAAKGSVNIGDTSLGKILVDKNGMTLYMYEKDTKTKSNCTGSCAQTWPPLTGELVVGTGLDATKLTTITRSDGSKQLAYNGMPLYLWTGDTKAGDVTGQDVQDFYAVNSDGTKHG